MRNMTVKYCRRVQPEWKKQVHWQQKTQPWTLKINRPSNFYFCLICFLSLQMMQKVEASKIFKDQKDSYPQSVGRLFLDSRLGICWYMHSLPPRLLQTYRWWTKKNTQHLRKFSHCFVQNVSKSISKWCRLSGMTKCRWDLQGLLFYDDNTSAW